MLFIIGIIAASIALYRIRVLAFRELSEEDAFDDNLLLLGLVAVLFYDLFLLIPAVGATEEHKKAGAMFVGKSILEMVQALLQVGHQKSFECSKWQYPAPMKLWLTAFLLFTHSCIVCLSKHPHTHLAIRFSAYPFTFS